jgi:hypothetical protein
MNPTTSRHSLLFARKEEIISTDAFAQTWKEDCGVGGANIVILIVNSFIFIPLTKITSHTEIIIIIRTTCRPIGFLYNLIEYLLLMEFYLITKAPEEVKLLLQEKLQGL